MNSSAQLRAVPVEDRAWFVTALADALEGGAPVLPIAPGVDADEVRRLQREPLPEGTAVVVRTSGSSGVPKAVALSADALQSSAVATHEALGGGYGGGQWLVTLPGHLISGLQMLVRSRLAGTSPLFTDGAFDPESVLALAERMQHPRRYISLVPVQLARLIDLAEQDAWAAEVLRDFAGVLVGGQATSQNLRQRAHNLGIVMHRSYGMTETAGGCVYDGIEVGDTRVRIRDGEVQLGGSCLALGYLGDAALTAERFIEDRNHQGTPARWYRTGDAGELLGGMLRVSGRLDRVIISGGVNVSLDEIERIAGEHAGWSSVVALGVTSEEWGERPLLIVESEPGAAAFDDVRSAIRQQLGPAAAPIRVTEVGELPRLPGGKPDREAIASLL